MNEPTKKQPVDELFARKLANLSVSPDERGFTRLQARMNQRTQPEKVVFWRTPTFQRSIAAAACLALIGTLGWYAQSTTSQNPVGDAQQAMASRNQSVRPAETVKLDANESVAQQVVPQAQIEKPISKGKVELRATATTKRPAGELAAVTISKNNRNKTKPTANNSVIERKNAEQQIASVTPAPSNENTTTVPVTTAPRTLVVTIAEPDVLVAAKQTAQEADQKLVVVSKNTTETGAGKLWRKIQHIRTGETALADAPVDEDEKGLLDRAYGQLKHSFQKNKPARQ
jgi:hypothetical protein